MEQTEQKLGVIGGMGPLATSFFFNRVISNTEAKRDQDHLNLVILNHATLPDRTEAIISGHYESLLSLLIADAETLERLGVSYIAIPCNTSHYFYKQIQARIKIPIINMVKESVSAAILNKTGVKKIGILATAGTRQTKLYENECQRQGLEVVYPTEADQQAINDIIYREVKSGRPGNFEVFKQVVANLEKQGCEVVLLACTELSYFREYHKLPTSCLDTLEVLARRAVELGGKNLKNEADCS